jgi:DNA-nicking Smr family endonuclease
MSDDDMPGEVELPITGELDLHTFRPGDIGDLLPDYFDECRKRGILSVRVIHGKGTGALREGVHRVLEKLPGVASWTWPAAANYGGWGATWVMLKA